MTRRIAQSAGKPVAVLVVVLSVFIDVLSRVRADAGVQQRGNSRQCPEHDASDESPVRERTLRVAQRNGSRFDPNRLGSGGGQHLGRTGLARPKPLRRDGNGPGHSHAADAQDHAARACLKDRFQLSVRNGDKDKPAYAIQAKRNPQLKPRKGPRQADASFSHFRAAASRNAALPPMTLVCSNVTMADIRQDPGRRSSEASGYVFDYPLLDRIGTDRSMEF